MDVASKLTVIICTHDRPYDLNELVGSLSREPEFGRVPVIIVDSASSTFTAHILRECCDSHSNVRYERLDEPGLSRARNLGAKVSATEWLAFLDDDAVVTPGWLEQAIAISESSLPVLGAVGGRILPRWPGEKPAHVGPRWLMFLSCIESSEEKLSNGSIPACYGANLMVRRSALAAADWFPLDLGRYGTVLLSGEEVAVLESIVGQGLQVCYEPALVVEHKIESVRLTRGWIRRRAFWGGVTEETAASKKGVKSTHLSPMKVAATLPLLGMLSLLRDPASDYLIRYWYARGVLSSRLRRNKLFSKVARLS